MLDKYLNPGMRVELKPLSRIKLNEEESKTRTYETRVYDVISDERVEIIMPMEQTKLILLPVDAEYQMFLYTDTGLYECTVRIVDRYKSNNVYLLLIELESNLRKFQRREYYRYSCAEKILTRELTEEEKKEAEQMKKKILPGLPLKPGVIVDISGGGLRFVTEEEYEKDSFIYCKYALFIRGGEKVYEVVARILDKKPVINKKGEFEYRIKYQFLSKDEREEIIQFIFESERKNRKRENGY